MKSYEVTAPSLRLSRPSIKGVTTQVQMTAEFGARVTCGLEITHTSPVEGDAWVVFYILTALIVGLMILNLMEDAAEV